MRPVPLAAAASLLASLAATRGARAQLRTALDAAVSAQRGAGAPATVAPAAAPVPGWSARPAVGAALRVDAPLARLGVGGTVGSPAAGGAAWPGVVEMSGAVATPAWHGLRAGLGAAGRLAPRTADDGVAPAAPAELRGVAPGVPYAAADAHVSLRRGASGAWLGADALQARHARRADGDDAARTLALRLGLWRQLRNVTFSVSAGARAGAISALRPVPRPGPGAGGGGDVDSTAGGSPVSPSPTTGLAVDSGSTRAVRQWAEMEARMGWARGRVALDGVVGARARAAGVPSAVWLQGSGAMGLAPGLALVASGGALPYAPATAGFAARRFVALGVRLSPAALWRPAAPPAVRATASAFAVRRLDATRRLVTLRVPGARVVELSGDFTGWQPVTMRQVDLDTWELVTEIAPGPHRCNVRVDGEAWMPPPGTTAVDDDYNGRVGLIVVE